MSIPVFSLRYLSTAVDRSVNGYYACFFVNIVPHKTYYFSGTPSGQYLKKEYTLVPIACTLAEQFLDIW